ncbi:MAG: histidine phosphatase family protein [Acidimicrobiales bacterium]|nr:histidine phosphatase family protein [Acidimicrobiales bacterium]
MSRLLLVRHGQSTWNAEGRWQGQADPPLSELGQRQAAVAVDALPSVDVVISSTLERAAHTAGILADGLGMAVEQRFVEWSERHAGEWQGLTRSEIDDRYPGYLEDDRRPPGYEDDTTLLRRTLRGIEQVTHIVGDRTAVVVTHGGVIYTLEARFGVSAGRIPNLGGRWLCVQPGGLTLGPRVVLIDHESVEVSVPDQI